MWIFRGAVAALLAAAAACTTAPAPPQTTSPCTDLLARADEAIEEAGVGDARAARIRGFPAHRVDRFLASFRDRIDADDDAAFAAWADRLRRLAREARRYELANLPAASRAALAAGAGVDAGAAVDKEVIACGDEVHHAVAADRARRARLLAAAEAPDHYLEWRRATGLYPLSALPIAIGYVGWKDETLSTFGRETASPEGTVIAYAPASAPPLEAGEVAAILETARGNPLDLPEPGGSDRARLLAAFAPVWAVDTVREADRIGSPEWPGTGPVDIDTEKPTTFSRLSHTWWRGRPVLQLNYAIWFPARPKTGRFDILGGHLDGVIWRVTLGHDGRPIFYDTIHQCGCYHMFFPVPPRRVIDPYPPQDLRERALVPQSAPAVEAGERMVVHLAHTSHYVIALETTSGSPANATAYAFAAADVLRSLPHPDGGRRSMFRPDGIVEGSQRLERFLLWPMGIASPGAMRQWGTHATAFVGRRHFDDPFLFETFFIP